MKSLKGLKIFISLVISISTLNTYAQNYFQNAEFLEYELHYGWITGGKAEIRLGDTLFNQSNMYHVAMQAKSTGLTSKIYPVNDVYESIFSPLDGLPRMAVRNISEGSYNFYNQVVFDHNNQELHSEKSGTKTFEGKMFDIVSAFYRLRNLLPGIQLKKDTIIRIETWFDDELFPLILRYKGIERIKTDHGEISCLKFLPVVGTGRVFKTNDDMSVWISNDDNHIPVRIQFDLFIGSLKADLISFSGLKYTPAFY